MGEEKGKFLPHFLSPSLLHAVPLPPSPTRLVGGGEDKEEGEREKDGKKGDRE